MSKASIAKRILEATEELALQGANKLREISPSNTNKAYEILQASKNERLMKEAADAAEASKAATMKSEQVPRFAAPEVSDAERAANIERTDKQIANEEKRRQSQEVVDKYHSDLEAEKAARKNPDFQQPNESTKVLDSEPTVFTPPEKSKAIRILKMGEDTLAGNLGKETVHFTTEQGSHLGEGMQSRKVKDTIKELRAAGEDARVTKGNYIDEFGKEYGEPSIMVSSPKDMERIRELAKQSGQESIAVNKGGKSQLEYLNGSKAGAADELGQGFQLLAEKPASGAFTEINTRAGKRYIVLGGAPAAAAATNGVMPAALMSPETTGEAIKQGYHKFEEARNNVVNKIADVTDMGLNENPYVPQHAKDLYNSAAKGIIGAATDPLTYAGGAGAADAAIGTATTGLDMYNSNKPEVSYVDKNPVSNPTQTFKVKP